LKISEPSVKLSGAYYRNKPSNELKLNNLTNKRHKITWYKEGLIVPVTEIIDD